MAGMKERYTVRNQDDGTLRTVVAQSHRGAKTLYVIKYDPPMGTPLTVWPQSDQDDKRNMRV